jgi:putative transposase
MADRKTNMRDEAFWHSRGYIPHFDRPNELQLITMRLEDAVPKGLVLKWKQELKWFEGISSRDPRQVALRIKIDKYEDAGYGAITQRTTQ